MLVENNWLRTNIKERLVNKDIDIKTTISSHEFTPSNFMDAAIDVCNKIKHHNLFLGLSGGADSDFVCHLLLQQNIKFTPLIAVTSGNKMERQYAFHTCRKFNLNPVVFELSDKDILSIYYERIFKKLGGIGIYAAQNLFFCDYIKEKGGKFLSGVNSIGGSHNINNKEILFISIYEFDFYSDVLYDETFEIPFNLYTPKIVYETLKRVDYTLNEAEFKNDLYSIIDFRPKMSYNYSNNFYEILHKINSKKQIQYIWKNKTKEELLDMLLDFNNTYKDI